MSRRRLHGRVTNIFWNADSWLPDKYQQPDLVCQSITRSLLKRGLYGPSITAYGDAEKFTDEFKDVYYEYTGFATIRATKGSSAHERLILMLVDLVLRASADRHRESQLLVVAKLSQDSEMICRVLGSLRQRGCHVLFTLPEIDVDVATGFGITVSDKQSVFDDRIPVWLRPNLFDLEWPPQPEQEQEPGHGDSKSYFIESPAPEAHTIDFTMPTDVDTCVFWDAEDYPLPPRLQLSRFYDNIKSAVRERVPLSSGDVSIYAYVVKEEGFAHEEAPRMKINVVRNAPADKFARLGKITMDFLLWSMDNPTKRCRPLLSRPNLLVISKRLGLEGDILCLRSLLLGLKWRGHNVFLALPDENFPPLASYDHKHDLPFFSWEGLTATTKRKIRDEKQSS